MQRRGKKTNEIRLGRPHHNPRVGGSNPSSATIFLDDKAQ